MSGDVVSAVSIEKAIELVSAVKGTNDFVIHSREVGEEINGVPTAVIVYESINSGEIYSLPYIMEDNGDGTSTISFPNGGFQLEGHGSIMYTQVDRLTSVPDTIESLLEGN